MKIDGNVLDYIKEIMQQNNISVYSLAKLSGINRSTLQKGLNGNRTLNIRQFNNIINSLSFTPQEKKYLYDKYKENIWGKQKSICNDLILEIFSKITEILENKEKESTINVIIPVENKSTYFNNEIELALKYYLYKELKNSEENSCFVYMPFSSQVYAKHIGNLSLLESYDVKASILFEVLNTPNYNQENNLITFANILPFILDSKDRYSLYYYLVSDYVYKTHISLYPYYLVFSNIAFLFSNDLKNMVVIKDKGIVDSMISNHIKKTKNAISFKKTNYGMANNFKLLVNEHIYDNSMYTIRYEPCISQFVPIELYAQLITDDFPNKKKFLEIINKRLCQIKNIETRYYIFNKNSINKFIETGNIVAFKHPCLKACSIEQRRDILNKILNSLDDKKIIMRAYSQNIFHISPKYEMTDIQNHHNFNITIYSDDYSFKLINISEPILSKYFFNFVHDIIETDYTYSFEETKEIFSKGISALDTLIYNKNQELSH